VTKTTRANDSSGKPALTACNSWSITSGFFVQFVVGRKPTNSANCEIEHCGDDQSSSPRFTAKGAVESEAIPIS